MPIKASACRVLCVNLCLVFALSCADQQPSAEGFSDGSGSDVGAKFTNIVTVTNARSGRPTLRDVVGIDEIVNLTNLANLARNNFAVTNGLEDGILLTEQPGLEGLNELYRLYELSDFVYGNRLLTNIETSLLYTTNIYMLTNLDLEGESLEIFTNAFLRMIYTTNVFRNPRVFNRPAWVSDYETLLDLLQSSSLADIGGVLSVSNLPYLMNFSDLELVDVTTNTGSVTNFSATTETNTTNTSVTNFEVPGYLSVVTVQGSSSHKISFVFKPIGGVWNWDAITVNNGRSLLSDLDPKKSYKIGPNDQWIQVPPLLTQYARTVSVKAQGLLDQNAIAVYIATSKKLQREISASIQVQTRYEGTVFFEDLVGNPVTSAYWVNMGMVPFNLVYDTGRKQKDKEAVKKQREQERAQKKQEQEQKKQQKKQERQQKQQEKKRQRDEKKKNRDDDNDDD